MTWTLGWEGRRGKGSLQEGENIAQVLKTREAEAANTRTVLIKLIEIYAL